MQQKDGFLCLLNIASQNNGVMRDIKRNIIRLGFIIACTIAAFNLSAQNTYIDFNGIALDSSGVVLCEGECGNLSVNPLDSTSTAVVWQIEDCTGQTFQYSWQNVFFCFDFACQYNITAIIYFIDSTSNKDDTLMTSVYVDPSPFIFIYSETTDFCEGSTGGGCDKVCEYSTVTYYVESQWNDFIEVDVQGAESYTVENEKIIVEWGASGNGFISVVGQDFNGCTFYGEHCVEIIPTAKAAIESNPEAVADEITICKGQSVYFESVSENAHILEWDFADGQFSTETNPVHQFNTVGDYQVSLAAFNSCYCGDTTVVNVKVLDQEAPDIDCVGTICENTSVTYTSNSTCSDFYWTISPNGVILDGGGISDDFVEIDWGSGPEGIIELSVGGCSGAACSVPNIFTIPIISDNALIEGPNKVCNGDIETYTIVNYSATYYDWEVEWPSKILRGQGTNSVVVEWFNGVVPKDSWIKVNYENCYLDCAGSDELAVKIRDEYFVSGPIEACVNSSDSYAAKKVSAPWVQGPNCNWKLLDKDDVVVWNSGVSFHEATVPWPSIAGRYTLIGEVVDVDDYCNESYAVFIELYDASEPVDAIKGETQICPNVTYTYEADSPHPSYEFQWYVNNGGVLSVQKGKSINVEWGAVGPYELSVTQIDYGTFPCESDPISIICSPLSLSFLNGDDTFCAYEVAVYETDLFDRVDYVWTIVPSDAGTIISGNGTNIVEVQWNAGGPADLQVDACGSSLSKAILVNALPDPDVIHPDGVCPGETAFVNTTIIYDSYEWIDVSGIVVSDEENPELMPGIYQLKVIDNNGCEGSTSFYMDEYPLPNVTISTPEDHGFCLPQGESAPNIFALDHDPAYSYQWYKDGLEVGFNKSSLNTSDYGAYYAVVTDINGCQNTSNIITLFEWCEDTPGGQCTGGTSGLNYCQTTAGEINFDHVNTGDCNSFDFSNTSFGYLPGGLLYSFGEPILGTSALENPSFVFPTAGYHIVVLTGFVQDSNNPGVYCEQWRAKTVLVQMAADFEAEEACAGTEMQFINRSTYKLGYKYNAVEWDFGDPASGADNTSADLDATHIFDSPGNYDVTLTLYNDDCQTQIIKTIEVFEQSALDFAEPSVVCKGKSLEFNGMTNLPATSWAWNFGDPASGGSNIAEAQDAYHLFETAGIYDVSLSIVNIFGCEKTMVKQITIEENNLIGEIVFTTPVCQGEVSLLTAPAGDSYAWSTGEFTQDINVTQEGVYTVTVTDNLGCENVPNDAAVQVIPAPVTNFKIVEYNDFGEMTGVFYNNYSACYGTDITVIADEVPGTIFEWSSGESGSTLEYWEDRDNLLDTGFHELYLNITDFTTGCENTIGPLNITIHPLPQNILLTSIPGGYLCQGEQTTIEVFSPEAGVNYLWNTGEYGTSITVSESGNYFAKGINEFGCEVESNTIEVHKAPDIGKIPNGCLERCNPDTLCVPDIPNLASIQWYYNSSPVAGPGGNELDFIADESGEYYVILEDVFGCSAQSESLFLELFDGHGDIYSEVYFDVNGNCIIDAGDTLMHDIDLLLLNNGTEVNAGNTGNTGQLTFEEVIAEFYTVEIDTNALDPGYKICVNDIPAEIKTCEDKDSVQFLIQLDCSNTVQTVEIEFCQGTVIDFDGISIQNDTLFQLIKPNGSVCDSVFNVTANMIPTAKEVIDEIVCYDAFFEYQGEKLYPGQSKDFFLTSAAGCDSVVTLNVDQFDPVSFDLDSDASCEGESTGTIRIMNISGGNGPYSYKLNTGNYGTNNVFENLNDIAYEVYIKDQNGCVYSQPLDIGSIEDLNI